MRSLLRVVIVNGVALYITSLLLPGLSINSGVESLIIVSVIYTILTALLTPILSFLTGPLNLITLGYFSSLITLIALLIMSHLPVGLSIMAFTFPGFSLFHVTVHSFYAPIVLSYVLISVIMFTIVRVTNWLFEV